MKWNVTHLVRRLIVPKTIKTNRLYNDLNFAFSHSSTQNIISEGKSEEGLVNRGTAKKVKELIKLLVGLKYVAGCTI